jgi:hypothetical protein
VDETSKRSEFQVVNEENEKRKEKIEKRKKKIEKKKIENRK